MMLYERGTALQNNCLCHGNVKISEYKRSLRKSPRNKLIKWSHPSEKHRVIFTINLEESFSKSAYIWSDTHSSGRSTRFLYRTSLTLYLSRSFWDPTKETERQLVASNDYSLTSCWLIKIRDLFYLQAFWDGRANDSAQSWKDPKANLGIDSMLNHWEDLGDKQRDDGRNGQKLHRARNASETHKSQSALRN